MQNVEKLASAIEFRSLVSALGATIGRHYGVSLNIQQSRRPDRLSIGQT
jgi:hypothetical protein